ncbi:hypothetical protein EDM80_11255 [bacterium]|nr:MAG: hypothetical protein EDM80_11255 [bacterium]RIK64701.1 MAG: hypothetical protein DCC64_03775 [Planctomycetota bacterium]
MTLLFVEYVPQVLMGLGVLIFTAVALDFAWARLKRVSQRLKGVSRDMKDSGRGLVGKPEPLGPVAEVGESLKLQACNDICSNGAEVTHESGPAVAIMQADVTGEVGAESPAILPLGADTERCEPVPEIIQSVGLVGSDEQSPTMPSPEAEAVGHSLIARAMGELQQLRLLKGSSRAVAAVDEAVVASREPSVRIVDTVVPGSERRVAM